MEEKGWTKPWSRTVTAWFIRCRGGPPRPQGDVTSERGRGGDERANPWPRTTAKQRGPPCPIATSCGGGCVDQTWSGLVQVTPGAPSGIVTSQGGGPPRPQGDVTSERGRGGDEWAKPWPRTTAKQRGPPCPMATSCGGGCVDQTWSGLVQVTPGAPSEWAKPLAEDHCQAAGAPLPDSDIVQEGMCGPNLVGASAGYTRCPLLG